MINNLQPVSQFIRSISHITLELKSRIVDLGSKFWTTYNFLNFATLENFKFESKLLTNFLKNQKASRMATLTFLVQNFIFCNNHAL